jgi:hypothetical protein
MTRHEALQNAIDEATAELKGPMTDVLRAWIVADRKDWRAELAALDEDDKKAGTA